MILKLILALIYLLPGGTDSPMQPAVRLAVSSPSPDPVLIGDSIFNFNRDVIPWAVDAQNGRGAYDTVYGPPENWVAGWGDFGTGWDAVQRAAPLVENGGWLVIELGTNDLEHDPKLYVGFIHDVQAALPNGRCLAWVIPYNPNFARESAAYEAVIRAEIEIEPCHAVIEWSAALRADPSLAFDGVHPSEAGAEVLVRLINEAVYK